MRKLKSSTLIDSQIGYVVDMEYGELLIVINALTKTCLHEPQIILEGTFTGVILKEKSSKPTVLQPAKEWS